MHRRTGIVAAVGLTTFLLCGASSPQGCTPAPTSGPSETGVVATAAAVTAGVVIGAVVLVEIHKSHHTIKGCVTASSDGLLVQNDGDKKTYTLVGVTAKTTVGDRVKLHGSKRAKGEDSAGDFTFIVEKIDRIYGPCTVSASLPAKDASAPSFGGMP